MTKPRFEALSRCWSAPLCFSMLAACGAAPSGPNEVPDRTEPATATRAPYADDLERARQLAVEAEAFEPPVPPHFADKAAALGFIKDQVMPWAERRRRAVERADAAYSALTSQLPEGESAKVALAQGNLALSFADDAVNAIVASAPPNVASNAEAMKAFRGAALDAVARQLTDARANFERCIVIAGKIRSSDMVSACQARLALLPKPAKPAPLPPPRASVADQQRPLLPTRQSKPCVFSGTLQLSRAPLNLPDQPRVAARFDQIEVEKLELPRDESGMYRLSTVWPIRGSFSLDQRTRPFALRSRVELIARHIWLSEGAAVNAVAKGGAMATVSTQRAGDEPRSTPEPVKAVPCSALEFARERETTSEPSEGEHETFSGDVTLSATPQGPTVGILRLREALRVRVLERQAGWVRIAAEVSMFRHSSQAVPYDFDAWTNAAPSGQTSGFLGVLDERMAATHETTVELDLSSAPGWQSFAKLSVGVRVLVGETRDGFVEVSVPGVSPGDDQQWGFWISEPALRTGARPLNEGTTSR